MLGEIGAERVSTTPSYRHPRGAQLARDLVKPLPLLGHLRGHRVGVRQQRGEADGAALLPAASVLPPPPLPPGQGEHGPAEDDQGHRPGVGGVVEPGSLVGVLAAELQEQGEQYPGAGADRDPSRPVHDPCHAMHRLPPCCNFRALSLLQAHTFHLETSPGTPAC